MCCVSVAKVFHPFWLVLHIVQGSYWLPMPFNRRTHTHIRPNTRGWKCTPIAMAFISTTTSLCVRVWVNTPACARRHKRRNIPQKSSHSIQATWFLLWFCGAPTLLSYDHFSRLTFRQLLWRLRSFIHHAEFGWSDAKQKCDTCSLSGAWDENDYFIEVERLHPFLVSIPTTRATTKISRQSFKQFRHFSVCSLQSGMIARVNTTITMDTHYTGHTAFYSIKCISE